MTTEEHRRLADAASGAAPWKRWGPYLSERAWGTVREDYSADGDAWSHFPFDHARSRTYRWNEDGLAGVCDERQLLCFSLALWNGQDPFLKERAFGLTNPQANHGEDAKDYWWYVDSTPTHSWMQWSYAYPQRAFPYEDLYRVNGSRSRTEPEYELLDTGAFDEDRYWQVEVDYAKAAPEDLCIRIRVRNAGPEAATIHLLPTLWFRNTWAWGRDDVAGGAEPQLRWDASVEGVVVEHPELPALVLRGEGEHTPLFCDNETNSQRLWGVEGRSTTPKDGIGDHVVSGADTVDPARQGTKAALWYRVEVPAGGTATVRLRLAEGTPAVDEAFDAVAAQRSAEADAFYAELTPSGATADEARVMRQAFAGMMWGKQYYAYEVDRWLAGDPVGPTPPAERLSGRNSGWQHIENADVISMPDPWEYPWYAVWDSAFHTVALAHVDPDFAKGQLLLFLDERYQHPNGQIPAYEWNFGDVNPPVHAWAVLKVFELDGRRDVDFLARCFHKLLLNFAWWVNKKDRDGDSIFEGGFLGLDNIGLIDRSAAGPDLHLEQSDGTAWVAMSALNLMTIALRLADVDPAYQGIAVKFLEHFCLIASSLNNPEERGGLWDDEDGFYYDVLHRSGQPSVTLPVRSMVGLVPLYAVEALDEDHVAHLGQFRDRLHRWFRTRDERVPDVAHLEVVGEGGERLLSLVGPGRLRAILRRMLDESEFLGPHGIRALSAAHRDAPVSVDLGSAGVQTLSYEPAESASPMFGGNSNWRGPVWFPVNYLLIESLLEFAEHLGPDFRVEHPVGSGHQADLVEVAQDLSRRLVSTFTLDEQGRRPVWGGTEKFQTDPWWRDRLLFFEYFHGDDGAGLGATHQTGWTGLVADLIASGRGLATPQPQQVDAPAAAAATRTPAPRRAPDEKAAQQ